MQADVQQPRQIQLIIPVVEYVNVSNSAARPLGQKPIGDTLHALKQRITFVPQVSSNAAQ